MSGGHVKAAPSAKAKPMQCKGVREYREEQPDVVVRDAVPEAQVVAIGACAMEANPLVMHMQGGGSCC